MIIMKYLKPLSLFLSIALLSVFTVSCDETNLTDPETNTNTNETNSEAPSTLRVMLTDAPGDFESVFIDIQEVRIHKTDSVEMDTTESDTTENGDDSNWITVSEEPVRVDLLTLQNGSTITLGETELESGTYNQIRLLLGSDNEVVVDGQSHHLKTPSAQQSGLKLKIDADIEAGTTYTLLIDFDASRSIVKAGNGKAPVAPKYILKPVLRAVDLEESGGSISGAVEPTDFSTSVFTVVDEDTIGTTTGEDGDFQILGLAAGNYDLNFEPDSTGFQDTTVTDIEVVNGEDTDIGTIELQEN